MSTHAHSPDSEGGSVPSRSPGGARQWLPILQGTFQVSIYSKNQTGQHQK